MLAPDLATTLRNRLDNLGMRQSDLAAATGTSKQHISHILSGRHRPSLDLLRALALALHLPMADLVVADPRVPALIEEIIDHQRHANEGIDRLIALLDPTDPSGC